MKTARWCRHWLIDSYRFRKKSCQYISRTNDNKDAINALPTAYKEIKGKITNKKTKAILNPGIDDYVVNKGVYYLGGRSD